MAYSKAVVDFSQEQDGDLSGIARGIRTLIMANAATFPNLPFTMAAFLTTIVAWESALSESLKGGKDRTTTKNDARAALEKSLTQLGTYVNLVADGDQATIDLSGFPSYDTKRAAGGGPVTYIPQDVRLERGAVSRTATCKWKGDGTRSNYEVQTCVSDPLVETNWTYRGSFSGGKAELDGFTPGTNVWARVRKIGTGGQTGPWSDPATTMVV